MNRRACGRTSVRDLGRLAVARSDDVARSNCRGGHAVFDRRNEDAQPHRQLQLCVHSVVNHSPSKRVTTSNVSSLAASCRTSMIIEPSARA